MGERGRVRCYPCRGVVMVREAIDAREDRRVHQQRKRDEQDSNRMRRFGNFPFQDRLPKRWLSMAVACADGRRTVLEAPLNVLKKDTARRSL